MIFFKSILKQILDRIIYKKLKHVAIVKIKKWNNRSLKIKRLRAV